MDTSEAVWCWYYLAECGVWHMFEIDPSAACSVTSEQIEQNYSRNQHGVMEFYTAKYTYRLDFSVMKQINVTTGKQRPIKRAFHSATGFRFICDNLALPVPCHWERINTDEPYQVREKDVCGQYAVYLPFSDRELYPSFAGSGYYLNGAGVEIQVTPNQHVTCVTDVKR
ncbi:unnamed protein product [Oncorhynchus mykiss]|uniref:WWE domain-containing protein n=1 Tax=Oncorhynchus mykiss TaxID=8022 RepID=A0A060Z7F2_ONCMY|nr:unnamed protein product [Oncorhynchus mykiss]